MVITESVAAPPCKPVKLIVFVAVVAIEVAAVNAPPSLTLLPVLVKPLSAVKAFAPMMAIVVFRNCPVAPSIVTTESVVADVCKPVIFNTLVEVVAKVVGVVNAPPKEITLPFLVKPLVTLMALAPTSVIFIRRKTPVAASATTTESTPVPPCKPAIARVFVAVVVIVVGIINAPPSCTRLPALVKPLLAVKAFAPMSVIFIIRTTPVPFTVITESVDAPLCKPSSRKGLFDETTCNLLVGVVVPIPIFPLVNIRMTSALLVRKTRD